MTSKHEFPFSKYPEELYQKHAEDLIKLHKQTRKALVWILAIAPVLVGFTISQSTETTRPYMVGIVILTCVLFWFLNAKDYWSIEGRADSRVARAIGDEGSDALTKGSTAKGGDRIHVVAGSGSMVLIGSEARDLIMMIGKDDQDLKSAMAQVSAAVEASGNKDAAESWKDFLEEAAGKKSKSKLRAFWDRTISLVPDIAKLADSVVKIGALFA